VSWRFDLPDAAERVGLLVSKATADGLTVTAHNLSDRPVQARMIGARVAPGRWRVTGDGPAREIDWGTGRAAPLTFPAGRTVELRLEKIG
jgi:hypothetical protein